MCSQDEVRLEKRFLCSLEKRLRSEISHALQIVFVRDTLNYAYMRESLRFSEGGIALVELLVCEGTTSVAVFAS